MSPQNMDLYLENQTLKKEFKIRNLDLSQIWQPTPEDLELENRQLRDLLDWVEKYQECPNRKKMEEQGYLFPPLSYDIDPDSDWLRFERWMAGKQIRGKLKDMLPTNFTVKEPQSLTDDEITEELQLLLKQLSKLHFAVDFADDLPPRLVYEDLMKSLDEEFELIADGWWHLDGCTGYCPDCFRRPWCDTGCRCCWQEDENAGEMVFPESVKRYVSPSPVSLTILRTCQQEEDRKHKEFMAKDAQNTNLEPWLAQDEDDDDDDLPF